MSEIHYFPLSCLVAIQVEFEIVHVEFPWYGYHSRHCC